MSAPANARNRYGSNIGTIFITSIHIVGLTSVSAQLEQPTPEALVNLDEIIKIFMVENNVPGGLVAVASKGKMLHIQPYGLANVELAVPVTDSTVFEIGSISKQFVSAAAMLLVEEKKLRLDEPIHKYLADLPSEWLGVKVRHLMTHTSGIPDYEEIATYDIYSFRLTPEEIIRLAHSRPMDFAPGTGWYYSNTGYFLLSMIIERIDGKPLGQVLQSRIFGPLKMTQTRMADPEAIIRHRAAGYGVNKVNELINRNPTETSSTLGAGGILSSVNDLVKWDNALYGNKLLNAKSKDAMWTGVKLLDGEVIDYGFGWSLRPYENLKVMGHRGQVAGFIASFTRFPNQDAVFIIFMNRYQVKAKSVYTALIHTFMPSLGPIPE